MKASLLAGLPAAFSSGGTRKSFHLGIRYFCMPADVCDGDLTCVTGKALQEGLEFNVPRAQRGAGLRALDAPPRVAAVGALGISSVGVGTSPFAHSVKGVKVDASRKVSVSGMA